MNRAFTLIELLVVVLIIGILSAIALPQYSKAVEKARMTEAVMAVEKVAQAQQIYKMANGTFTRDINDLDIDYAVEDADYCGIHAKKTKHFLITASNCVGDQVDIALVTKSNHYTLTKTLANARDCILYDDVTDYEEKLCLEWEAGH